MTGSKLCCLVKLKFYDGSFLRSILVAWSRHPHEDVRNKSCVSDASARMSRGCYDDATRKLLSWNSGLQRHKCVNNLPNVVTWQWNGRRSNSGPLELQANALTVTHPPGHTKKSVKLSTIHHEHNDSVLHCLQHRVLAIEAVRSTSTCCRERRRESRCVKQEH